MSIRSLSLKVIRIGGAASGETCHVEYLPLETETDNVYVKSPMVTSGDDGIAEMDWRFNTTLLPDKDKPLLKVKLIHGIEEECILITMERFLNSTKKARCRFDSKNGCFLVLSGRCLPQKDSWTRLFGTEAQTILSREAISILSADIEGNHALQQLINKKPVESDWETLIAVVPPDAVVQRDGFNINSFITLMRGLVVEADRVDEEQQRLQKEMLSPSLLRIIIPGEEGLTIEIQPDTTAHDVMICIAEQGISTFNKTLWDGSSLILNPQECLLHKSKVTIPPASLTLDLDVRDTEVVLRKFKQMQGELGKVETQNTAIKESLTRWSGIVSQSKQEVEACQQQLSFEGSTQYECDSQSNIGALIKEVDMLRARQDVAYRSEMLLLDLESKRDELAHRKRQNDQLREHLAYLNNETNELLVPWKGAKEEISKVEDATLRLHDNLGLQTYTMELVNGNVGMELGQDEGGSIIIIEVEPHSPAYRAGLESGLIVFGYNDSRVRNLSDLNKAVSQHQESNPSVLTIEVGEPTIPELEFALQSSKVEDWEAKPENTSCSVMLGGNGNTVMPSKKKAKWKLVNGELIEIKDEVVRAPMRPGGERLTDGLFNDTPNSVTMRPTKRSVEKQQKKREPFLAEMERAAERQRETKRLAAEMKSRSGSPMIRSISRSPSLPSRTSSPSISNRSVSPAPIVRKSSVSSISGTAPAIIAAPIIRQSNQVVADRQSKVKGGSISPPPAVKRSKNDSAKPTKPTQTAKTIELPPTSMLARMRQKAVEDSQARMLPPRLYCVPAAVSGNSVALPEEVKEIIEESESTDVNQFFQLRKDAKIITVVATSWRAPQEKIGLSSSLMKSLNLSSNEFLLIKKIPQIPKVEKITLEVTEATYSKGIGPLNAIISKELKNWGCAEKGDRIRVDGMRLKVKDLYPSPAFFGFGLPEITFSVKQRTQQVAEITTSAHHTESQRISDGFVRINVPLTAAGTLRIAAKNFDGKPASAILYITEGDDDQPTPDHYKWGGADLVDCPFDGTAVYHTKIVGDPCVIHASILQVGRKVSNVVISDTESDYSQSILSYFISKGYVPSPSEVEARLPTGVELSFLNCFDSLLLIGKRSGDPFIPPHTSEWSIRLRNRLTTLPVYLQLALAIHLPSLSESPEFPMYVMDLKAELSTAAGADTVLLLLKSLASQYPEVRKNTADILQSLSCQHDDINEVTVIT